MDNSSYKDFENQLRALAKEKGAPFYGSFELTGRCNFDCKMCYVHVADSNENRARELSTKEIISIIDSACNHGMLYATLTGGECLLRSDFSEIYSYLINKGVKVTVKTNAFLISQKHIDLFLKLPPREISVTLYGSNNDVYSKVTGIPAYKIVTDNILKIHSLGIPLKVSLTPCRYNVNDIPNIVFFLVQNDIKYAISPFLIPPREGISRDDYFLNADEQLEMLIKVREKIHKPFYNVDLEALPDVGGNKNESIIGIDCSAGSYRFCVTWDGYMVPCLSFDAPRIDLRRVPFLDAWRQILDHNMKVRQPIECNGCAYKAVCIRCPVCRYDGLYSGHCNTEICKFTLNKVKSGLCNFK
ncbi:MAG: radical SAM protein [Oscillospiraceae bacterium]|nr:radical SAM protein [Oscillospiraceae bacterium]